MKHITTILLLIVTIGCNDNSTTSTGTVDPVDVIRVETDGSNIVASHNGGEWKITPGNYTDIFKVPISEPFTYETKQSGPGSFDYHRLTVIINDEIVYRGESELSHFFEK